MILHHYRQIALSLISILLSLGYPNNLLVSEFIQLGRKRGTMQEENVSKGILRNAKNHNHDPNLNPWFKGELKGNRH